MEDTSQSALEELFNSITCGIGACLSVVGLVVLVGTAASAGDAWRLTSVTVYGISLVLLFLVSTLYHSIPSKKAKRVFEILDHCMIYVLIAGTYMPFALVTLRGPWGWTLFGLTWGLTLVGVALKIFYVSRFRKLSGALYLLMGWLVVIALRPLLQHLALGGVGWLLAGGIIYSSGFLFYAWRRLPFHHTIWHGFVLTGGLCHFIAVLRYVLPT